MKFGKKFILLGALTCASIAQAQSSQQIWEKAVTSVAQDEYFNDLTIEVTQNPSKSSSPLEAKFVNGVCYVNVDTKYNGKNSATYVESLLPAVDLPFVIKAGAVHEFAHCYRQQSNSLEMMALMKYNQNSSYDGANLLRKEILTRTEETFADVFSLVYAKNKYPTKYTKILDFFLTLRSHKSHTHGVLPAIQYIKENGIKKSDDYFGVAEEITENIQKKGMLF